MRNGRNALLVTLALALALVLALPSSALATTVARDGMLVELKTDKESYKTGDTIVLTLNVSNKSGTVVGKVTPQFTLPSNLVLLSSNPEDTNIGTLEARSSKQIVLTATAGGVGVPQSGGTSNALWIGLSLVFAAGIAMLLLVRRKTMSKMLSLMLCLALALSVAAPMALAATPRGFSVETTVLIDDVEETFSVQLDYITYDDNISAPESTRRPQQERPNPQQPGDIIIY